MFHLFNYSNWTSSVISNRMKSILFHKNNFFNYQKLLNKLSIFRSNNLLTQVLQTIKKKSKQLKSNLLCLNREECKSKSSRAC